MKNLISVIIIFISTTSFANSGSLDGSKYCRSVQISGMFGQPPGKRNHCVSFDEGRATDNGSTFFGNPPELFGYEVIDQEIFNTDTNLPSGYEVRENSIIIVETNAILIKVK